MAFTNLGFYIDGVHNESLGISSNPYIVRTDAQIETPWIGAKQIIETNVPYVDMPYFYGTKKEPLSFRIKFSILDNVYTHSVLTALGLIFGKDKYVSFQTADDLTKIYYVIPVGQVNLITHGEFKGWYEIELRTNAPHAWSIESTPSIPVYADYTYVINNTSNVMNSKYKDYRYFPKMKIELVGASTSITITNVSDGNRQTTFTGLNAVEILTVDNKLKTIVSSTGNNRFSNFNKNWLYLIQGNNTLKFSSDAFITFTLQYPTYA